MLRRIVIALAAAALLAAHSARADEPTRQVQEELRRRNLYHGDIDGRQSPALAIALKEYQQRKGFAATGEVDADTLRSMSISEDGTGSDFPNVPVLRSDRGMAQGNHEDALAIATPAPVNAPPATRGEVQTLIRNYLNACQTPEVADELNFYAPRVDYFDHGAVTKTYVRNELVAYNQQWPERQYTLGNATSVNARGFETVTRCRIAFQLGNQEQNRHASGETDNTFVLARRQDLSWEITSHKEERVKPAVSQRHSRSRKKSSSSDPFRRMQRSVRKLFR